MSLIFTGSTSNYYKIDHTVESIAAAEDEWVVSIVFKLDSTASADATAFQILGTDESGYIKVSWEAATDRLYIYFNGSGGYASDFKANYGDDWTILTMQRIANGNWGFTYFRVGQYSTGAISTWPNSSTAQPTGGSHYIGVGYNGTSYEDPWVGEIADVYFGSGPSLLQEATKGLTSEISMATMHPIEMFGADATVYSFNFDAAAATETDLVNGVDAVKIGTVTSGDPPTRGVDYEPYELYPRPTDVAGYYVEHHSDMDISIDQFQLGMMLYVDTTKTTGYTVVLETEYTFSSGEGAIRVYLDHAADEVVVQYKQVGSNLFRTIPNTDFADRWGFLCISREAADEIYIKQCRVADSDTIYTSTTSSINSTFENYNNVGWVIGNGAARRYGQEHNIAEVWLIEDTLTDSELADIAHGSKLVTDYAAAGDIKFYFPLKDGNAIEPSWSSPNVSATEIGAVPSFTHPITNNSVPAYSRWEMPNVAGMDLSSYDYTFGIMFYGDSSQTGPCSVVVTDDAGSPNGGFKVDYYPDLGYVRVTYYADAGGSEYANISTSVFDDQWGLLTLQVTSSTAIRVGVTAVGGTGSFSYYDWTPSSAVGNFDGHDLIVGNTAALDAPFVDYVAEVWLVEGTTLTSPDIEDIADGNNHIQDYAAASDILYHWTLDSQTDATEDDHINSITANRYGSHKAFTHPVDAAPAIPPQGMFSGDFGQLTGILDGTQLIEGTVSGDLTQLRGDLDGASLSVYGEFASDFPALHGLITSQADVTGPIDGSFGAIDGVMAGKTHFSALLVGDLTTLIGHMDGISYGPGTFAGLISNMFGALAGTTTSEVIIETVTTSSSISLLFIVYRIIDAIIAEDANNPIVEYGTSVIESLVAIHNLYSLFNVSVSDEVLVLSDSVTLALRALGLTEAFLLNSSTDVLAEFTSIVSETTELWENALPIQHAGIDEIGVIADALDIQKRLLSLITDATSIGYQALVQLVSNVEATEAVSIAHALDVAYVELINEITSLITLLSLRQSNVASLSEIVAINVTLNSVKGLALFMAEVLAIDVSKDITVAYEQAVAELMKTDFYISISGDEYKALVFNTETEAPFFYSNYPFNSFSGDLAATSDGIYRLEGDTDDGTDIDAYFETGYSDFGTSQMKRFQPGGVYIGFANDGSAVVKVSTSNNGNVEEDWYEEDVTFTAFDTERLKVHDGIKSRYWKFKVLNKNGSHLDLDTLQLYPIILNRRLR